MADIKTAYAASSALTITLASMATDSNLLTGRESTAVANGSNLYLDYLLSGKITTGTSPTANKSIEVWLYGEVEDTPTYPDVFDGTDSAETVTSADVKRAALRLAASINTASTSNVTYWFGPVSVASLYGGRVPRNWGVFVTHNTGVNLHATGGNHAIWQKGVYATSA